MTLSSVSTFAEPQIQATSTTSLCKFKLVVFSKYDESSTEVDGPTLSISISHALPELRHLAHSRAVFGARRCPYEWRTYGSWELIFPEAEARPSTGYEEFAVRHSVSFDDALEIFDVLSDFDEAEGLLRYRAQELGDDDKSLQIIDDGVCNYVEAAYQVMLWDPKAQLNIAEGLDKLFLDRDWSRFISLDDLKTPTVAISDVELIAKTSDGGWLVRFHYMNGEDSGYELEFADLKKGRLIVRTDAYSALRSAVPAFRGDQLPQVYEALQTAVDRASATIREMPALASPM